MSAQTALGLRQMRMRHNMCDTFLVSSAYCWGDPSEMALEKWTLTGSPCTCKHDRRLLRKPQHKVAQLHDMICCRSPGTYDHMATHYLLGSAGAAALTATACDES